MAKKKPTSAPSAAKSRKPKTVSVKKIVAEIERAVAKLEAAKATTVQARGAAAGDPQAYALDRAIMSLRAAGDVAKGTCVPGFDIPI
jgi:hypothetical protein